MNQYLERLRRASWSYKQPLTQLPKISGAPVSDLFIWRNTKQWETFFELTNMPALFDDSGLSSLVTFKFFDATGREFLERKFHVPSFQRTTLALSEFIENAHGNYGTFCVFHARTPDSLVSLGSHLAERGYLSYRYCGAPLRAYVHGNLDAIAQLPNGSFQMLGGASLRKREYRLQHSITGFSTYEIGLVNATVKNQRVVCNTLAANDTIISMDEFSLASGESHLLSIDPQNIERRLVISSHMAMARPLVFRTQNKTMDVFHG